MDNLIKPAICRATKMTILLDNGHASSTSGKCSPDKSFYEGEFNREIVKRIANELNRLGISYHIITPEVDYDVPLTTRANRVNEYCKKYGKENCLLISVHANAAGMGTQWMNARGWSIYTTIGLTDSDKYADIIYKEAENVLVPLGIKMRPYLNKEGYYDWESNFTILYKSACPAVLTENLFYDNKDDLEFLKSEKGKQAIVDLHVNAIKKICL